MTATGHAGGAGTIVNAMATGKGAAFGLTFEVRANAEPARRWQVFSNGKRLPPRKAALVLASAQEVARSTRKPEPQKISVTSDIPPERGLKSSSAVSIAVIRANLEAQGLSWSSARILRAAARAGLRSGTSVTGAYDDAAACLLGGAVVTDNKRFRLVRRGELPGNLEALVHIPEARRQSGGLRGVDFSPVKEFVGDAWSLANRGRYDRAMILNSAAYCGFFGHEPRFSLHAIREGAWSAGLSGKGPAEIALGTSRVLSALQEHYPSALRVKLRRRQTA